MKAIIYNSNSKHKRCEKVAFSLDGDRYEIKAAKPIKSLFWQMVVYGFMTVAKKPIEYHKVDIDFNKYEEIILVSPVWAGQVNAFMRSFLKENPFHDKKVTIIGCADGANKKYFESFKGLIDGCCEIVGKEMYIKGIKQK